MMKIAASKHPRRIEHFGMAFSVVQYVGAFWSFHANVRFGSKADIILVLTGLADAITRNTLG
jgi:hypothetical protein